jgi:hypothetical protein
MEDAQKSQTISTETQGIAEQMKHDSSKMCSNLVVNDSPPVLIGEVSMEKINPTTQFNDL